MTLISRPTLPTMKMPEVLPIKLRKMNIVPKQLRRIKELGSRTRQGNGSDKTISSRYDLETAQIFEELDKLTIEETGEPSLAELLAVRIEEQLQVRDLEHDAFKTEISRFFSTTFNEFLLEARGVASLETKLSAFAILLDCVCALPTDLRSELILAAVTEALNEFVFSRLHLSYESIGEEEITLVAKMLVFSSTYHDRLVEFFPMVSVDLMDLDIFMEELLTEYIQRAVRDQFPVWLQRCVDQNKVEEIREELDSGNYVTSMPQILAPLIESQLSIASDLIPPKYVSFVVDAIQDQLLTFTGHLMVMLSCEWKTMPPERLAAVCNDSQAMISVCEEKFSSFVEEDDDKLQDLNSTWTQLSLSALQYLNELEFIKLRECCLQYLGGSDWLASDEEFIEPCLKTLDQFMDFVRDRIADPFFHQKAFKMCFDFVVQGYLDSFLGNTMKNGLVNSVRASEQIQYDWLRLTNYFCFQVVDAEDPLTAYYSQEILEQRLGLLEACGTIVNPNESILSCTKPSVLFLTVFGRENGMAIVLHLAGLRTVQKKLNRRESKEWHVTFTNALVEWKKNEESHMSHPMSYRIPDLRNSKYMLRLKHKSSATTAVAPSSLSSSTQSSTSSGEVVLPTQLPRRRYLREAIMSRTKKLVGSDQMLYTTWKGYDRTARTESF